MDTFSHKILSQEEESKATAKPGGRGGESVLDYEDLCNLSEASRARRLTAQMAQELGQSSATATRPKKQKSGRRVDASAEKHRGADGQQPELGYILQKRQLTMSQSSRVVDWSDKLKHMEIKDVMDIDIGHMREEMADSPLERDKSVGAKKSSLLEDSFSQYLEKLKQEDDHFKEDDEFNYNLDQLGSYQVCYIDNKTPVKNRGPVPEDLISHLDYLDEGVLIMQPENQQNKPIRIEKKQSQKGDLNIVASRGHILQQLERPPHSRSANGTAMEASPFTRLLTQAGRAAPLPPTGKGQPPR